MFCTMSLAERMSQSYVYFDILLMIELESTGQFAIFCYFFFFLSQICDRVTSPKNQLQKFYWNFFFLINDQNPLEISMRI